MRVVLFGQKWLAVEVLDVLCALDNVQVVAVCPDEAEGRLAIAAQQRLLPVVALDDVPLCDLGVAAYCQRFIPGETRRRCGLGVLAYHPSLLPRHRGRDAIHWALAMHEPITGGSAYWMDSGADTGPIEAQDWCHILPDDTPTKLWRRELAPMGVRLIKDSVARLAAGRPARAVPQDPRVATWEPAMEERLLSAM